MQRNFIYNVKLEQEFNFFMNGLCSHFDVDFYHIIVLEVKVLCNTYICLYMLIIMAGASIV